MVPSNEEHTRPRRNTRIKKTDRIGWRVAAEAGSMVDCWVGTGVGEKIERAKAKLGRVKESE